MSKYPKIRRSVGWAVSAATVAGLTVVVFVSIGSRRVPGGASVDHPIDWDGHRWAEFSPEEKQAFLGGFLAGAAASQAYEVTREATEFDRELLRERVAALRSEGAFNYPYGANLYYVRLHDYYFYVDRRERPLYEAISELNFSLQKHHR